MLVAKFRDGLEGIRLETERCQFNLIGLSAGPNLVKRFPVTFESKKK